MIQKDCYECKGMSKSIDDKIDENINFLIDKIKKVVLYFFC